MDRLIYSALSGMRSSMERQRVLASNMANAETIGFRAELMDARAVTVESRDGSLETRAMQSAAVRGADMSQGEMTQTGRSLDLAVDGDALIAVQAEDGSEAYTRRGDLTLTGAGLLVNGEGRPVLGEQGPITVPPGGDLAIAPDGVVTISNPATPDAPPAEIGRIKLASPAGSQVTKGLDNLFRVEGGGVLPTDLSATVKPGYLEQSNVKLTEVLVDMVDQQRLFDMRTKLVATAKELDESGASLMRLA